MGKELAFPKDIPVNNSLTPTVPFETPTVRVIVPNENVQPTLTESPTSPPATATEQPSSTPTLTSLTLTATTEVSGSYIFDASIALIARDIASTSNPTALDVPSTIGIFNAQANSLQIVAQPADNLSFGRPQWSPNNKLLAFVQLDSDTSTHSIQVYDVAIDSNHFLEVTQPQSLDGDNTMPGLFLFGWSGNGEWLAYEYTYDASWPEPRLVHLLNISTGENISIEVPNPENYLWFVWSPRDVTFAMANGQAILVGDAHSPDQLTVHQKESYLGLIAWHPSQNQILVGSSDNLAGESWNQLWQLDLNSGKWIQVDRHPWLNDFIFSAGGEAIAIHSQYPELNSLEIVDAHTFKLIQEIKLPTDLFFGLDWQRDSTLALTSKDNIFVVSLKVPTESFWVFNTNNPLYNYFSQITFTDW